MITVILSEQRGHFNYGWLDTYHTFSFGDYYDPGRMGFRQLRALNEDRVQPGKGFGEHPHRNMEIVTYIVAGALEHRDSMGYGEVIRRGDVPRMTAGRGITHSEYNPSQSDPVHLLQIWILPERHGLEPSYEQRRFADDHMRGWLGLVASRDGRGGAVRVHQDVELYACFLGRGQAVRHDLGTRYGWVQVVKGAIGLNGRPLSAGDGAAVSAEPLLEFVADGEAEFLLFSLS